MKQKALNSMQIASKGKLTCHETTELNQLDKQITNMMLKAENNIKDQNNSYLWSPELHNVVRSVFI